MAQVSDPPIKRSASSLTPGEENAAKRQKRHYHHHHQLLIPIQPSLPDPVIPDDASVTHLLNRSISQVLTATGFDIAEPVALDALRNATEEYILHFASLARQMMAACRRTQPIPQDFEHALRRSFIDTDDLLHVKSLGGCAPVPTLLPSPPPEVNDLFGEFLGMPVLDSHLSGEDDKIRSTYIPSHFPQFPSKHTYRYTPVFTEREDDPRKVRERATEEGRHGEEALRKLARAAFKDTHTGALSKGEKRLWGRKNESMESMFEKTVRGLAKKTRKPAADGQGMDIDSGDAQKQSKAVLANIEMAPIVNCERNLWRKSASAGPRRVEKPAELKDSDLAKVERWVTT